MRVSMRAVVAFGAVALLAAACGSSPSTSGSGGSSSPTSGTSASSKFLACMVTDTGGIDDKSFNQSSWAGHAGGRGGRPARSRLPTCRPLPRLTTPPTSARSSAEKCGIIVTVGFLMADATEAAAKANPSAEVRDRRLLVRLLLPERHQGNQHRPAGVQHRAGRLPRRLPGGRHEQDACRSYLRR